MKEVKGEGRSTGSKRLLGLIGSPRRLGNCEVLVKEIATHAPPQYRLDLIRLPSLNILQCSACYACVTGKECPKEDDVNFLLEQIAQADAIIITTPVYVLGAYSIFKDILDRGFLFYNYLERTFGKPCVLATIYGMNNRIGATPQTLRTFAALLGLEVKTSINVKAALPGEVLENENEGVAGRLSEALFSTEDMAGAKEGCPFCGCEVVRMDRGLFVCTLCQGTFSIDGSGTPTKISDGGMLGTPEHMLRHRDWLKGMKERFFEERKERMRLLAPFKAIGNWIEP